MSAEKKKEGGVGVLERQREETKEPPKYRVILLNDDYTPQDFVVLILVHIFRHELPVAKSIMLKVHNTGRGIAGIYSREVAETKTAQAQAAAAKHEFPLEVIFEPDA